MEIVKVLWDVTLLLLMECIMCPLIERNAKRVSLGEKTERVAKEDEEEEEAKGYL